MSTNRELPARPSLEQLKKQAKELARAKDLKLADAQFTIAREYGFPSWPALKRHVEIVQRPREWNDEVWGADTWPFFAAILSRDEPRVRAMLDANPSLARTQYGYLEALHFAARTDSPGMVKLLLDAGANPLAEGWSGKFGPEFRDDTPLGRARDRGNSEIIAMLERAAEQHDRRQDVETFTKERARSPRAELEHQMMLICHRGDADAAIAMLNDHPDLASAGLYEAVHQIHPELVKLLLDRGARVNRVGFFATWYTPLMHALRYPQPRYDIAQMLLDHGVDPNETNGTGMTALHVLAAEGTRQAAEWLLDRGADVDARDHQYESRPLAWAARAGREDMVKLLLNRGSPAEHPDDPAWATPRAWAARRGHAHILQVLDRHRSNR